MNKKTMDFETLRKKVLNALNELRVNDDKLLEIKVNERTISHKLAEYLQKEFELCVDCEYNKHDEKSKELDVPKYMVNWNDTEAKTVYPDIIIHERKTDDCNLLVIEMKKSSNRTNRQFDKNKLMAFTKKPYHYQYGLFLEIDVNGSNDCLEWYENGILCPKTNTINQNSCR